jgi:hypothetical protein
MRRQVGAAAFAWIGLALPGAAAEPPSLVAFVIDTSGSVGENLGRAQGLALGVLGSLPAGSEVAVFTFDDQSRLAVPRTSNPAEVQDRIRSLRTAGRFTALHDALYDASRYLRDAPGSRKAIVLITDGRDENSALNLEDGLRLAQEAHIPVYAVGVGSSQERVLRRIAKLSGGEFMPLARARGRSLAALITALPASGTAPPAPAADAGTSSPRTPARDRPAEPTPSPRLPAPPVRGAVRAGLAWGALGLLVLVAGGSWLVLRSRGARERPQLGAPPPGEDPSPTVVTRMNITEEFLEKTVTLRDRPVLNITRGPGTGESFNLATDASTSIGRAKANDIVVNDVSVSSQHCRIRPENGHFVLHDLKSTNGTYVNERKVSRHTLSEGDVIRLGETSLQYRRETSRS